MKDSFDDILKKKWEEFHFPVDNDHRNDMIRLLDQQHRRRTGLFWWFGGIGGGIVIMAAIILLINRNPSGEQAPVTPSKKHVGKEIIAQNIEKTEELSSSTINQTETDATVQSETESGNVEASTAGSHLSSGSSAKSPDVVAGREVEKITFKENTIESESKHEVEITTQIIKDNNNNVDLTENSGALITVSNTSATSSPSVISNESAAVAFSELVESRNHFGITDPLGSLSIDELLYERGSLKKLAPVVVKRHPVFLFAETGLGLIPSSQPKYSAGWTWKTGAGLDYGLNTQQHLSLAIGYLLQKDGFDFEKSSTVQQLDFGARSNFHSLSPDKLHFVYARAGYHQRIHRHVLSLFAGTQYLYGAQGTIEIQSQGQLAEDVTETKYGWLNIDGMTRWLWSGEVQYGYQLLPKLSVHAGLKYNFTSLKAPDDSLEEDGYYWDGKISSLSPFFTINYHLYGKK